VDENCAGCAGLRARGHRRFDHATGATAKFCELAGGFARRIVRVVPDVCLTTAIEEGDLENRSAAVAFKITSC